MPGPLDRDRRCGSHSNGFGDTVHRGAASGQRPRCGGGKLRGRIYTPGNPDALRVKRVALEQLLAASGQENFSEAQWLEQEIKRAATDEEAR